MKTRFLFIMLVLISIKTYSQVPFTTIVKVPRFVEVDSSIKGEYNLTKTEAVSFLNKERTQKEKDENMLNSFSFFKNNSLSVSVIQSGNNRVSVSSEILHYKLFFREPIDSDTSENFRYNIPLMLVSKLSTKYDSINSSSSWDVLDYEAAPVTLRIMPSWMCSINSKKYKDAFYYGFYADVRGINLFNNQNKYDMEFIGTSGMGFTYISSAEADKFNNEGQPKPGKFSLSIILQAATGKKEVIDKLFKTKKDYVASIQTYLNIIIPSDSSLNLKIGYQYLFQDTLAGNHSNFSISLGI